MKKISLIVLSVFIFSLFLNANAQSNNSVLNKKEVKNVNQERIQERKEVKAKMVELREDWKLQKEEAKVKIEKFKTEAKLQINQNKAKLDEIKLQNRQNVLKRFEQTIEIMKTRKENVTNYLTKASNFINTEDSKNKLGLIDDKILNAEKKATEISLILSNGTETLTQEQKNELKKLRDEFHNYIKSINDDLKTIVKNTKEEIRNTIEKKKELEKTNEIN